MLRKSSALNSINRKIFCCSGNIVACLRHILDLRLEEKEVLWIFVSMRPSKYPGSVRLND